MLTDDSVLVPPGRLAALLSSRRKALGLDIAQMAHRSDGKFSALALGDLERGRTTLDDGSLRALTDLYELEAGPLVPARSRLIVDLRGGEMRVGATGVALEGNELDTVLERYLSLLYLLRNLRPGSPLTLRDPDVEALSGALQLSISDVEQRLGQLLLSTSVQERSRLLGKRLMVPGAGILVGITAVGALVIVGGNAADAGKLSTPSLNNPAASAQTDLSPVGVQSDAAPLPISGANATGGRLILPSGVVAEVVERSDTDADADDSAVVGAVVAADATHRGVVSAEAEVVSATATSASPRDEAVSTGVVSTGAVSTGVGAPSASEDASVPTPEVAPVSETEARAETPVVVVASAPAAEAESAGDPAPTRSGLEGGDPSGIATETPPQVGSSSPVAPVQVPAIVIPQATVVPSIQVVVPAETVASVLTENPAPSEVEIAEAVQVSPGVVVDQTAATDDGGQFTVESSALSAPGFIVNEAPDDDLFEPTRTPAPVEVTEAPLVVTAAGPYAQLGAQAEALISYDFRSQLPGWTIRYEGDTPGYRGLTNLPSKTISIFVNDGDSAFAVAEILGHEVGHALDVTHLGDDDRHAWLAARNMPSAWWPGDGLSDFHVGAGDWAEGVAAYLVGSPSYSAYGGFTEAQLQLVGELLPR